MCADLVDRQPIGRLSIEMLPSGAFERDDFRALLVAVFQALAYLAFLALALSHAGWLLNLIGAVSAGAMASSLINIGHDALHQALTSSRALNDWIGRLAFIPVARSASLWIQGHNQDHHGFTNIKGRDHAWAPMSPQDYAAASVPGRWLYRAYRGPAGLLLYPLIAEWILRYCLPILPEFRNAWRRHLFDALFVIVSQAALIAALLFVSRVLDPERPAWLAILLGWLIPLVTANFLFGLVTYLHHTHPHIPWFTESDTVDARATKLFATTRTLLPQPTNYQSNFIMEHNAHHLYPKVPFYALVPIELRLRELFDAIIDEQLTVRGYFVRARACKLYDFAAAQWVDFDGRPTGPILKDHPAATVKFG